jgi:protein-disulfide isomerase
VVIFRQFNLIQHHLTRFPVKFMGMLLISFILCSRPAQAAPPISPELEEQVLQIIRKHPEVLLESVQAYQQRQQAAQRKAQQDFLQQLQANPRSLIGQSPTKGAKAGKLVLVEFSDFQCPYCAQSVASIQQFLTKHPDVTLVYKHFPLTRIHAEALPAAKAAWAAGQQGKFWEFHDALFQQQKSLGEGLYRQIATTLGLDMARFERDRTSPAAAAAIAQDVQMAEKLGVSGTPFFVLNGQVTAGGVKVTDLEALLAPKKTGQGQ